LFFFERCVFSYTLLITKCFANINAKYLIGCTWSNCPRLPKAWNPDIWSKEQDIGLDRKKYEQSSEIIILILDTFTDLKLSLLSSIGLKLVFKLKTLLMNSKKITSKKKGYQIIIQKFLYVKLILYTEYE